MSVSARHILSQGPVVAALLKTASAAMRKRPNEIPPTPGREFSQVVAPRSNKLIDDYIRHCGGSPSWYRGVVPAHLFPQWGFPLQAKTLDAIPYDLTKVLNGGCRIEVNAPLPRNQPLHLRAWLEDIDDNGSRAVIKQKMVTGTADQPDCVVTTTYAIVPLKHKKGEKKKKKERPGVPADAREIGQFKLHANSGWEFAVLTGDFNPVHWVPPYAKAAGFKNTILHGFATLGRSIESMNKNQWSGDPRWLKTVDVRFTRPVILPARPYLFASPGQFFVGDAPGGPAYLVGELETEKPSHV